MSTGATKSLSVVTSECFEQAVAFALAKSEYLSHEHLLLKTINPDFASDYELGGLEYSHMAGCFFKVMEWPLTMKLLLRHEDPRQLVTTYAFQFVEKLDTENKEDLFWVMSATERRSKWADEGYIVTTCLPKDWYARKSIHRFLKNHGLGMIQINPIDYQKSRVINPAIPHKDRSDYELDRLFEKSDCFRQFSDEVAARLKTLDEL